MHGGGEGVKGERDREGESLDRLAGILEGVDGIRASGWGGRESNRESGSADGDRICAGEGSLGGGRIGDE
jgi:hypothetical protein